MCKRFFANEKVHFLNSQDCETLVRDDPKLLDDGGEIPKSQGRG
jgi:hypothetical protein